LSTTSWAEIGISVLALIILALAAVSDTVIASTSRARLRQLAEDRPTWRRTIPALLEPGSTLAASLQIVQVIAVVIVTTLLTSVIFREIATDQRVLAIILVVACYVVVGRALPDVIATNRPEWAAAVLLQTGPISNGIAWPFRATADVVARGMARLVPHATGVIPAPADDEFRRLNLHDHEDDEIEKEERAMIHGVLHLEELTARDIMVPRIDIVAAEVDEPFGDILAKITQAGHSRIPVYRESIDHLEGILYAKDLLPYVPNGAAPPVIEDLLRPLYVVPESKCVSDLLTELRRRRVHIAIVVDEYGGVAGLVTIEDVLEEIVGEIQDEYDMEQPRIVVISEDEVIADGRLSVENVEEALRYPLEREDHEDFGTLGGFVQARLGRLPRGGDQFDVDGIHVEILEVDRHRIRRVRLQRREHDAPDELPEVPPAAHLNGAA
jgi:CBS domain containing-hemolysin-like protein